jgi:hypothetical protein
MAGASGASGAYLAGLAVLSAVSARRVKCQPGAVQQCVPAVAALPVRLGWTAPAAAAATALTNHHGQHD